MGKRTFEITFENTITIELDDAVINAVDDEWRSYLYDLHTPSEIAEHVGYNLVINQIRLSSMDGWADQPDSNAKVTDGGNWEVGAIEIIEENK